MQVIRAMLGKKNDNEFVYDLTLGIAANSNEGRVLRRGILSVPCVRDIHNCRGHQLKITVDVTGIVGDDRAAAAMVRRLNRSLAQQQHQPQLAFGTSAFGRNGNLSVSSTLFVLDDDIAALTANPKVTTVDRVARRAISLWVVAGIALEDAKQLVHDALVY
jgi:hypothetical protein